MVITVRGEEGKSVGDGLLTHQGVWLQLPVVKLHDTVPVPGDRGDAVNDATPAAYWTPAAGLMHALGEGQVGGVALSA